jgi:ABC-2 type transport system permease protein
MNRALLNKAFVDARLLLAACTLLMFVFHWVFVWITAAIKLPAFAAFLRELPPEIQNLSGVPVDQVATTAGRIALVYVDPIVLVAIGAWAISRGSDTVSGEIDRGTMEMLLAQPVHRLELLVTQIFVTLFGAALLALAGWLGIVIGILTVTLDEGVAFSMFLPASVNTFALTLFLAGISTLASSWDRYRWRTVGLMGAFYVVGVMLEVIGRGVSNLFWVRWFTFMAAYEPQAMTSAVMGDASGGWGDAWSMSLHSDGILIGLGLAAYVAAAVIFGRRDLPAPL